MEPSDSLGQLPFDLPPTRPPRCCLSTSRIEGAARRLSRRSRLAASLHRLANGPGAPSRASARRSRLTASLFFSINAAAGCWRGAPEAVDHHLAVSADELLGLPMCHQVFAAMTKTVSSGGSITNAETTDSYSFVLRLGS